MLRYVLDLTRGFRGRIALTALAGLVRVIIGLVFVALSKRAVDIATGQASGELTLCIVALIGAVVVELLFSTVANRNADLSEAAMKNALQERLFGRLLKATWSGRETHHSGDMLSRLTEDCRVAADALCRTVPAIIIAASQLAGAFFFLWYFSPVLAVILFLLLPAFILAGKVFFRKVRVLTRRIREVESRLQERMQESLQHRLLLLTYRQTRRTMESISALHRSRYRLIRRRADITTYSRTAVWTGFEAGYLTAFLWGITGLRNGTVSFGLMTAYLQLAGQLQRPMAELARLIPGLIQSHTAFSRLEAIGRMAVEPDVADVASPAHSSPAGIAFRDVTFRYPGKERALFSRFSHTFMPGTRTALTGETGAGKSTILRLILALLHPQEGTIELFREDEGTTCAEPVSASTRGEIVYVPQGNTLLSGSIRDNLLIGNPDATEEEMGEVLHAAAADFISDLPDGLDTICGEHGDGLSEGQAQRIAIARALLRPGSILLLDEISASLDEATETLLMKRLTSVRATHTIILVTHRPGILPYCDSVLRLSPKC